MATDEGHLVFEWQTFREKYYQLDSLRKDLPTIPFMALSATMSPHIVSTFQSMFNNPLVSQGSVNRPNIKLYVEKLPPKGRPTGTSRGDFTLFFPKGEEYCR